MMLSDIHNDHTSPYEQTRGGYWSPTQLESQASTPVGDYRYGQAPGPTPPSTPQGRPKPPKKPGGWRAGAILALAVVLLLVFGTGLFSGWQFARSGTLTGSAPATSTL